LSNFLRSPRFELVLARAAVLLSVVLLVCVPTLTRMGQRLETATHAPSFRNIDGPPKKVLVAPALAVTLPIALPGIESVRIVAWTHPAQAPLSPSPFLSTPTPLRAPPSALLA
jgi:ABC-type spermidine/putrescine transport system permease subunit II